MFGGNMTAVAPGSVEGLHLVVSDIEAARKELLRRGIKVSEPFHDTGGVFLHADGTRLVTGLNPQRQSYASYASFSDPDGNGWLLQEVTVRLSGDIKLDDPRFTNEVLKAIHTTTPGSPSRACRSRNRASAVHRTKKIQSCLPASSSGGFIRHR
jgi:hypothetical protein